MPGRRQLFQLIVFIFVLMIGNSFRNVGSADGDASNAHPRNTNPKNNAVTADALTGAWMLKDASGEQVLIFIDNYFTQTTYSVAAKKFFSTRGGTYSVSGGKFTVNFEFSTPDKSMVGTASDFTWSVQGNKLTADINTLPSGEKAGSRAVFTRIDDGSAALAGNWQITGRMQGDKMNEMRPGARKTIKILSGTRFQWAAINTETKEFSGTGGGNYTFKDGKYTENIEFFSRDSSRVGASLSFEGSVENGKWIHKGLSSRGEKIHEVWSRSVQP